MSMIRVVSLEQGSGSGITHNLPDPVSLPHALLVLCISQAIEYRGRGSVAEKVQWAEVGLQLFLGELQLASQTLDHPSPTFSDTGSRALAIAAKKPQLSVKVSRAWRRKAVCQHHFQSNFLLVSKQNFLAKHGLGPRCGREAHTSVQDEVCKGLLEVWLICFALAESQFPKSSIEEILEELRVWENKWCQKSQILLQSLGSHLHNVLAERHTPDTLRIIHLMHTSASNIRNDNQECCFQVRWFYILKGTYRV